MFGGITRMPHYRGSDEHHLYVLPLPYVIYRGKIVQADRDGVRGIFVANRHFESSLSVNGNPPVSSDNEARQGMPDLGAVGEVGPSLKWFFQERGSPRGWCLRTALRAAASLDDGHLSYRGLHGGLNLLYDDSSRWDTARIRYGVNLGVDLADTRYNRYFYGVAEEYRRPNRSAYAAAGGYGGCGLSAYAARRITRSFSIGLFARWDNLAGAVFEDSPLVRRENDLILATALIWRIAESRTMVPWNRDLGR